MQPALREHPFRIPLTNEVHARPYARLRPPERATYLAMLSGEDAAEADRLHVARLCRQYGKDEPTEETKHLMVELDGYRLKWERHTEFSSYTFLHRAPALEGPFENPVINLLPPAWLKDIPGELLVGIHLELQPSDAPEIAREALPALFGSENFASSMVAGGAARVTMDFSINSDGFGRALVRDIGLRPRQAGRLCQRLLEIETYRMMALLAFPLVQRYGPQLTTAASQLTDITEKVISMGSLESEQQLFEELTRLSAEVERMAAGTEYRFGASRAYFALVERRIRELREERVEGEQTIGEFMERRLAPAMRSCESLASRVERLSQRLARSSELLRTRVDIQLEAQNSNLLASMDRRARIQLRLQETVEGLSVAAITYYVVGLVNYAARAVEASGLPINTTIATGASIPVVAILVWMGIRRIRRKLSRAAPG